MEGGGDGGRGEMEGGGDGGRGRCREGGGKKTEKEHERVGIRERKRDKGRERELVQGGRRGRRKSLEDVYGSGSPQELTMGGLCSTDGSVG